MTYRFVARDRCPACASTAATPLWKCRFDEGAVGDAIRSHYGTDPAVFDGLYQLDQCRGCGLIFQRFIGDDRSLAELYATYAHEEAAATDSPSYLVDLGDLRGSRDAHELMTLARYLQRPKLKVLDYGTGWGLWPTIAHRLGHDAYGVELAADKAAWAARHGVTMIADDDIGAHRFDVINLEQVLEHVPEPLALLEKVVPSLGGVLKLSVPNAGDALRVIRQMDKGSLSLDALMPIYPLEHINSFTRQSLRQLGAKLGLVEVRPSWTQRYAFLRGGIPRAPKRMLKEVLRPFWTFSNKRNLYMWFVRH